MKGTHVAATRSRERRCGAHWSGARSRRETGIDWPPVLPFEYTSNIYMPLPYAVGEEAFGSVGTYGDCGWEGVYQRYTEKFGHRDRGAGVTTIFLDRDGVINENRADYVKSWQEFRFLPGSLEAIARLTRAGHRLVVCTNQAAVAKGLLSCEALEDIHRRMLAEIEAAGGIIEKVYYCPHSKDADCACRKPRPGLLLRARDELGLDLSEAVFVGDSITDVQAGIAAGVHTILVLSGLGIEQFRVSHHEVKRPFRIAMNLRHAVEVILNGMHIHSGIPTSLERACYSMLELNEPRESLLSLCERFAFAASEV